MPSATSRRKLCRYCASAAPRSGLSWRSPQSEDRQQGFIDTPLVHGAEVADELAEATCVDSTELLDEHPGGFVVHLDLGTKRCGPRAPGGRSDNHDRAGQDLVCLDDNPISVPVLLMTEALRKLESVDVTAKHAVTPSTQRRRASRRGHRRLPRERRLQQRAPNSDEAGEQSRSTLNGSLRSGTSRPTPRLAVPVLPRRRVERRRPRAYRGGRSGRRRLDRSYGEWGTGNGL